MRKIKKEIVIMTREELRESFEERLNKLTENEIERQSI